MSPGPGEGSPLHVALAIALPLLTGLLMYRLFGAWDAWRRRRKGGEGLPPVDYSI